MDEDLFDSLVELENPTNITGITNDKTICTKGGNTKYFGFAYYLPTSAANVISLKKMESLYNIEYNQDKSSFIMKNKTIPEYVFEFQSNNESKKLYSMKYKEFNSFINTNNNFCNNYCLSKIEFERAVKALKLHEIAAHPSTQVLKDIIKYNSITNISITEKDVDNMNHIFGDCPSCAQSKITDLASNHTNKTIIPNSIGEVVCMDLLFIEDDTYLTIYDKKSNAIFPRRVQSKSADAIYKEFDLINKHYFIKYGHKITNIYCDNEKAFQSLANNQFINLGIKCHFVAPNQHQPNIERQHRLLRERFNAVLRGLDYKFPKEYKHYLMEYVASMLNSSINANNIQCPK